MGISRRALFATALLAPLAAKVAPAAQATGSGNGTFVDIVDSYPTDSIYVVDEYNYRAAYFVDDDGNYRESSFPAYYRDPHVAHVTSSNVILPPSWPDVSSYPMAREEIRPLMNPNSLRFDAQPDWET
jgi:hypothetical protein